MTMFLCLKIKGLQAKKAIIGYIVIQNGTSRRATGGFCARSYKPILYIVYLLRYNLLMTI